MSRVLKSSRVVLDADNFVRIETPTITPLDFEQVDEEEEGEFQPFSHENLPRAETPEELLEKAKHKAKDEANRIIQEAEERAQEILRDVEEQAAQLAYDYEMESRREGYDAGYNEALEETQSLKDEAKQTLKEARAERKKLMDSAEGDMLALIVKIVNKLLANTIHINPQVIMVLIRAGLSNASLTGNINIRVSPEDYETVMANKEAIERQIEASSNLEIMKDLSLRGLDCVIETPYGDIDCSLERQYKALVEQLYLIYGESQSHMTQPEQEE